MSDLSRKRLACVALVTLFSLGWFASADASILAQSTLDVNNFQFLNPNGTTINANQLDVFVFQDSSQGTANLNGTVATQTVNSNIFGTLDLPQQCVGQCGGFAQNDFSQRNPPATLNVARADTLLTGAPIINPAGISTPATARLVTEGQLTSIQGNGNVQANLGLTASFSFSLTNSQAVIIDFDTVQHLVASVGLTDALGSTARSSTAWSIEIRDQSGALVFQWTPNGVAGSGITGGTEQADACNMTATVNAQLPGQTSPFNCSGHERATTGVLDAALTYTLGLRHEGASDVTRIAAVPAPAGLLLLGLGLIGAGFLGRRKM
jgi:hypothetical protein